MIDIRKYDERYVAILYGSSVIIGKLHVGETVELKDSVTSYKPLETPHGTYYARKYGLEDVTTIELNERNINAVLDITDEIYKTLEHFEIPSFSTLKKKLPEKKFDEENFEISPLSILFGELSYEEVVLKNAEKIFHTSNLEKLYKGISRLSKLKSDIEKSKEIEKQRKEKPKRRLPFVYYP